LTALDGLIWGARLLSDKFDAIVEANRELLLQRSQLGLRKYGVGLDSWDPTKEREILQHALEEALDLANYLQCRIQAL
jgi:hypothetical protein